MSRSRAALVALLMCASSMVGCGGAMAPRVEEAEPVAEPHELDEEQHVLESELDAVLARPEPRCELACDLSSRICDLSSRICGIAERQTDDPELAGRCSDSDGRCRAARARVEERCTCE